MFLKNAWYVAALAREVTRFAPLARKLLSEDVVLFRTHNGTVAALEDRCPHRFAPLSMGRMSSNGLVCGYHGMEFDPSGACVANPTQPDEPLNPRACVRSYPVVERHNLVWIWMGDPDRAEEQAIPDYRWYDDPDWDADLQYMHIKGNYLLLLDNLFDLSHVNFVHGDVLGSSDRAPSMVHKTKHTETGLVDMWLSPNSPMVPGWAAVVSDDWAQGNVDFWMDMHWEAPSNMMLDVGVMPVGGQRKEGLQIMSLDGLTPETATSTHYFYGTAQSYRKDDRSVLAFWAKAQTYAFEQDKRVIEAVQERMGDSWDILAMNPIINKGDKASLLARRSLAKLIRQEQGLEAGAKGITHD
ncbi:aromatic ring-hydroxylating dioxygenase subunit alpha [Novosphingobium sp. APW14]|uniref:aromatic ring-hydroxylating dioxygenase subunit alpha n=1 Tax=Novosphingobium sp. APW14 TaxID=3077237 RepID=UPI0028DDD7D0|nr:aromatic ring-hydroxylating dioxygenase subunit alpha [Novosphingobium sp. APW14]MDT9013488.1 aromatic ring-hydroxylating dioxygenase subunit alpha [Novosphingobium sp. APW14]